MHLWAHLAVALSLGLATARSFFTSTLFRVAAFVVFLATFSLTEMALAAPLLLALLHRLIAPDPSRSEKWLAFVLPVVRIDLCVVPLASALVLGDKRGLRLALAALAGGAVQLATMKLAFGSFVSVAAWLKASMSLSAIDSNVLFNFGGSAFQDALVLAHLAFAGLAVALRRERTTWLLVFASLSFLAMHLTLSLLRSWYFVPSSLGILFTLERSSRAARPSAKLANAGRAAVTLLTLVFLVRALRTEIVYRDDQRVAATFLPELRARISATAPVYTWDNPGFLGFFSGFPIVDGDGLVNDFAYARRLRGGGLAGYLDEEGICHVVVAEAEADPILEVAGLVVRREDATLLYAIRRHVDSQADFVLYRLNADRCVTLAPD